MMRLASGAHTGYPSNVGFVVSRLGIERVSPITQTSALGPLLVPFVSSHLEVDNVGNKEVLQRHLPSRAGADRLVRIQCDRDRKRADERDCLGQFIGESMENVVARSLDRHLGLKAH